MSFRKIPAIGALSRALLTAGLLGATLGAAHAAPTDLLISEYVEGSGNNKAIELFNGTGANIDLAAGQYALRMYFNANTSVGLTINLTGTVAPGATYVIVPTNASAELQAVAAKIEGSSWFNGNDTVVLVKAGQVVDSIGKIAANPSTEWGTGLTSTADNTLRRKPTVTTGDTNPNDAFDPAVEWVGYPTNTFDGLGSHTLDGGTLNGLIVPVCPALGVTQGEAGSVTVSASDTDSRVNWLSATSSLPTGITLGALTPAAADGDSASALLSVAASTAVGSYAIGLQFANDDAQTANCTVNVTVSAAAGITRIPAIQGSGTVSPYAGQTVTTEGVVSAVFPGLSGFYLQDEDGDGDVTTSDGIFVYAPSVSATVGQRLRVTATVTEYYTVTELTSPTVQVLGVTNPPQPTDIELPEAVEGDLERYEGMLVRIVTPLTVSQTYFLGRYGQVTLAAGGALEVPTNRYPAGSAEVLALRDDNARRRILLDDGSSSQNPNPIPFIGANNTLRGGDTVQTITGVIDHGPVTTDTAADALRDYKIHPTVTPVFERSHPRTAAPEPVGGNVKVASFNVLNYFTTIDQAGSSCYPSGTRSDCRGADSAVEFTRQRDKIVAALRAVDADVIGLMEIENNGQVAVQNLVNALNQAVGSALYAAVGVPAGGSGTDAIRVAMIYKPSRVSLVGGALSDTDSVHNRPPLAQTFAAANGEKFSVVVNHFKSKSCGTASGANADLGDGQSCWNALRVQQADALHGFVKQLETATGAGVLVIGDLNAYGKEDPINALTGAGLVDLSESEGLRYSYTFDGENGQLDHAIATQSLAARVSGLTLWHINTDEPSVIDYNTEYKPQDLYAPTAYRSSDHDPVVIGLSLVKTIAGTAGRDTLTGTAGDDVITGGAGPDTLTGGAGADVFVYRSVLDGTDTITDFVPGTDRLLLDELLASLGITPASAWAAGNVRLVNVSGGVSVQIDADGTGPAPARALVTLRGVTAAQIDAARDLGL